MIERGTSNSINGNPNAGKTTLYTQVTRAQLYKEPELLVLAAMTFPEGRIAWVQTDRSINRYKRIMIPMGLYEHPAIDVINFVDDTSLHKLTRPRPPSQMPVQIEQLREEISKRIKGREISIVILDLDPFQRGSNSAEAEYYSRATAIWAKEEDIAVLSVGYPFKQTTAKQAMRIQDRTSGFLHAQASQDWKFTIIDNEENDTPYHVISAQPPAGMGQREEYLVMRGNRDDGDPIGLFTPYTGPRIPTVQEIMKEKNWPYDKAWRHRKTLLNKESFPEE